MNTKYRILITLSAYEDKVSYEMNFWITCKDKTSYSISKDVDKAHYCNSVEEAEAVLKLFVALDFSYGYVVQEYTADVISTYYIRHKLDKVI
jgi:hypothetical protein